MTDRHYALFANNQHPIQLEAYENYNRFLRQLHDAEGTKQAEATFSRGRELIEAKEAQMNAAEGEMLSIDDLEDIHMQVEGERRSRDNHSLNTVNKQGNIDDYLEQRRPFGTGSQ